MFEKMKLWLGIVKKHVPDSTKPVAIGYHRKVDLPDGQNLTDRLIAVCRNGQLVLAKTGEAPDRLEPDEVCWVFQAGDVLLPLHAVMGENEIQADVRIAFDPDHTLARFLLDREKIGNSDILMIVSRCWSDLADLETVSTEKLLSDSDAVSRFRRHLSLLLQEYGLRCVGIDRLEITRSEETIEAELVVPEEIGATPLVADVGDVLLHAGLGQRGLVAAGAPGLLLLLRHDCGLSASWRWPRPP